MKTPIAVNILFIIPYPLKTAPSQRFRFEQYFPQLKDNGYRYAVSSFLTEKSGRIFSSPGNYIAKSFVILRGLCTRIKDILRAPAYDYIFIHREASPIGPPVFEWILRFALKKKIIYDFDDAIWLTDKEHETTVERVVKCRSKINSLCRWAHKITCANSYLQSFAAAHNDNVIILPTTLDTDTGHNPRLFTGKNKTNSEITIGWTGSYSTLKYLTSIEGVIQEITREYPHVTFLVIADQRPNLSISNFRFSLWNRATEVQDLLQFDIGVMPLTDNTWTRGKSAFKCLQYMALEIPPVASSVGINKEVITHGQDGFLAQTKSEWKNLLLSLIHNKDLRKEIGAAGRAKVTKHYSVAAHSSSFLSLFK